MIEKMEKTKPVVNVFAAFATSPDDAENGKWFTLRPGLKIKLRRLKSKKSQDVRRQLEEPYADMADIDGNYPDEINEKLLIDQLAEAIVVDWTGFGDRDGNVLACTPDNVRLLMADPALADLRDKITIISMKVENFRESVDQATIKN